MTMSYILLSPSFTMPLLINFLIQIGIGSVLTLTGTPDPDDNDHLGIAVSTQYIEQQMIPALQNATVS